MFRRVVSILVLPCVLLTQAVTFLGHAHADRHLPGHDPRPHFHIRFAPAGDSQTCHHHHAHGPDATEPGFQLPLSPETPSDHDTDAVYVGDVDVFVTGRSAADVGDDRLSFWVATALGDTVRPWPDPSPRPTQGPRPPPAERSRPLYVLHLTLLI